MPAEQIRKQRLCLLVTIPSFGLFRNACEKVLLYALNFGILVARGLLRRHRARQRLTETLSQLVAALLQPVSEEQRRPQVSPRTRRDAVSPRQGRPRAGIHTTALAA